MAEDWESVLKKLEKGNKIRDRLSGFDLRGKSSLGFPAGNDGKGKTASHLVGPSGKATTKKYIIEHDYSSIGMVLLLVILGISLLMLLYYLSSVVAKLDVSAPRDVTRHLDEGDAGFGTRQLKYTGGKSAVASQESILRQPISPASVTITEKIKCTAEGLLRPKGTGECI